MASEIDICNMALSAIRAGSINSLTEASLQAQQCKLHYPFLRDSLLREGCWGFSRTIAALALRTDDVFNWVFSYQYPSDCLKLERLILDFEEFTSNDDGGALRHRHIEDIFTPDLERQIKHEINNIDGNKVILANEQNLRIKYSRKITDPNLFDVTFIQTLVSLLSSVLAIPLVGGDLGRGFRSDNLQLYNAFLKAAIANDKNEGFTPTPDSEFILIRR
jgi:hypothetical protein